MVPFTDPSTNPADYVVERSRLTGWFSPSRKKGIAAGIGEDQWPAVLNRNLYGEGCSPEFRLTNAGRVALQQIVRERRQVEAQLDSTPVLTLPFLNQADAREFELRMSLALKDAKISFRNSVGALAQDHIDRGIPRSSIQTGAVWGTGRDHMRSLAARLRSDLFAILQGMPRRLTVEQIDSISQALQTALCDLFQQVKAELDRAQEHLRTPNFETQIERALRELLDRETIAEVELCAAEFRREIDQREGRAPNDRSPEQVEAVLMDRAARHATLDQVEEFVLIELAQFPGFEEYIVQNTDRYLLAIFGNDHEKRPQAKMLAERDARRYPRNGGLPANRLERQTRLKMPGRAELWCTEGEMQRAIRNLQARQRIEEVQAADAGEFADDEDRIRSERVWRVCPPLVSHASDSESRPEATATMHDIKPARQAKLQRTVQWLAEAMLLVRDHPDWSDREIADTVGKSPGTLSRSEEYQAAARLARSNIPPPKGFIKRDSATGLSDIEAHYRRGEGRPDDE